MVGLPNQIAINLWQIWNLLYYSEFQKGGSNFIYFFEQLCSDHQYIKINYMDAEKLGKIKTFQIWTYWTEIWTCEQWPKCSHGKLISSDKISDKANRFFMLGNPPSLWGQNAGPFLFISPIT